MQLWGVLVNQWGLKCEAGSAEDSAGKNRTWQASDDAKTISNIEGIKLQKMEEKRAKLYRVIGIFGFIIHTIVTNSYCGFFGYWTVTIHSF